MIQRPNHTSLTERKINSVVSKIATFSTHPVRQQLCRVARNNATTLVSLDTGRSTEECEKKQDSLKINAKANFSMVLPLTFVALIMALVFAQPSLASQGPVSFVLHFDKHLLAMIQKYGAMTYAILFTIVFCETGLVFTPFLPGDSLLFAAGALCGLGYLALAPLLILLNAAAILGDTVNYFIGKRFGKHVGLRGPNVEKANKFFAKHGRKTIILARFVPIVRTFAPFVAGGGLMSFPDFMQYNVVGALLWTILFISAGYVFGNIPAVQSNFTLVILAIVLVSVIPIIWDAGKGLMAMQSTKVASKISSPTDTPKNTDTGPSLQ